MLASSSLSFRIASENKKMIRICTVCAPLPPIWYKQRCIRLCRKCICMYAIFLDVFMCVFVYDTTIRPPARPSDKVNSWTKKAFTHKLVYLYSFSILATWRFSRYYAFLLTFNGPVALQLTEYTLYIYMCMCVRVRIHTIHTMFAFYIK